MNLFKMNVINIFRSFAFKIFTLLQIMSFSAIFYMYTKDFRITFYNFFIGVGFFEMPIIVLSTCFAIYSAIQKITLENICFIQPKKSVFVKFTANMFMSFTLLILPIIVMLCNIPKTDVMYTILGIIELTIRWSALIISTQIIGFLLGKLFQSYIAYIFAIPLTLLFTYLNDTVISIFADDLHRFIQNMFIFNRMFPYYSMSNFSGPIISIFTTSKSMMMLSFFIMMLSIYFIYMKSKIAIISTSVFIMLSILFFSTYSDLYPKFYSYQSYDANIIEKFNNDAENSFEVSSYSGELSLKEFMDASIILSINKLVDADILELKLDSLLNITNIKSNGQDISYNRHGDYLYIDDKNIINQDNFDIEISYSGRISYSENNIYTTQFASSLPSVFAFIPLIKGDDSIHTFDIDVSAKNTVISNVDFTKIENNLYNIKGESDTFMLYCGFIDQYTQNNQTIYYGKYLDVIDISLYTSARDYKTLKSKDIDTSVYEKVFILSNELYGYGLNIDYNDYLIIASYGR